MEKVWVWNEVNGEEAEGLAARTGLSPFLAKILLSRGIRDEEYIRDFLESNLSDLHDPFLMNDMEKAAERILQGIRNREKMVIYGDYDVDGVTSTSILFDFLSRQKAEVEYYIPDRMEEGYGLSVYSLDKILAKGVTLLITVDCGITALDEVEYCKAHHMDVIITDHHECKESLPQALAVVSPSRKDNCYPYNELAGVGVTFKLIQALCKISGLGEEFHRYLELAAMGTIADVVPLTGENRIIVKWGLERMKSTWNKGIQALMEASGQLDKPVNAWTVAYVLAPRVNAAGRMGDASRGVRLFTTGDAVEAKELANQLNEENRLRQEGEAEIFTQAIHIVESTPEFGRQKVLVVDHEGWHHGIIGIVASKISERYYKPCIMISTGNGLGKGSGRSIEGLDLFAALSGCEDLLQKFGGHAMAAGITIRSEDIPAFRDKLNGIVDDSLKEEDRIPKLKIDLMLQKSDLCLDHVYQLERMAPFGAGNPAPLFGYPGMKIQEVRTLSENKHLKLKLEAGETWIDSIGFHFGEYAQRYEQGDLLDVAGTLEINRWNGIERLQINLRDIKPPREANMERLFYQSLDLSVTLSDKISNGQWNQTDIIPDQANLLGNWEDILPLAAEPGVKAVILLNSLEILTNLEKLFRNSSQSIKKELKICYTSFNGFENGVVYAVVNPKASAVDLSGADRVLLCGSWADSSYFNSILQKAEGRPLYILHGTEGERQRMLGKMIPDRSELEGVFRYIRDNCRDGILEDRPMDMIKKIRRSFGMDLNDFKLSRIIEVFSEMGFMKRTGSEGEKILLELTLGGKGKTDLEISKTYRALCRLKEMD